MAFYLFIFDLHTQFEDYTIVHKLVNFFVFCLAPGCFEIHIPFFRIICGPVHNSSEKKIWTATNVAAIKRNLTQPGS